ncbi:hypothetical protein DVH24_024357 [Malus domestica]|uniref:Uncharacterized protein n=1 Tax=Malus domestica TaxID=3750 RepID=A0A498JLJ4_MALDO|nr:hypothetical protein DVH24_024357 [Malus domestica]
MNNRKEIHFLCGFPSFQTEKGLKKSVTNLLLCCCRSGFCALHAITSARLSSDYSLSSPRASKSPISSLRSISNFITLEFKSEIDKILKKLCLQNEVALDIVKSEIIKFNPFFSIKWYFSPILQIYSRFYSESLLILCFFVFTGNEMKEIL